MPQRSPIFVGPSFATTYHRLHEPDWRSIEALSSLVRQRPDLPHFHPGEFMWMSDVISARRQLVVHLYKHIDTRRYLNLDDFGHAYGYIDQPCATPSPTFSGRYRRLSSLPIALDRLGLHEFETSRLFRSFPPHEWPPLTDDCPSSG